MVERVTGMDAAFLELESPTMHLHVVGALVLDPSTADGDWSPERLARLYAERMHLIPPFRQRLVEVPAGMDHPRWIEDPEFDLDRHLHFHTIGPDATTADLEAFVGEVCSRPLRRDLPLWQTWLVDGFADGTVALVTKVHHALMDGSAGGDIMASMFDLSPDATATPEVGEVSPATTDRIPSRPRLLGAAVPAAVARLARVPATLVHTVASLAGSAREVAAQPSALASLAPASPLNGQLTAARTVAFRRTPLDDVLAAHRHFEATVNDIVLAAVAIALRDYLAARGERPEKALVASVPVAGRREGEDFGNHTSNILVSLPVHLDDPVAIVEAVREDTRGAKAAGAALDSHLMDEWLSLMPAALLSAAGAAYSRLGLGRIHPPLFNTIVSNLPGPPMPLYLAGARLVSVFPMGPLIANTGLNLTVISHDGTVDVGIIACPDLVDDVGEIADRFVTTLAELERLAAEAGP
jgi:WS/DGAT/MGAT family acyltransferase